jgi:hypothetical protein
LAERIANELEVVILLPLEKEDVRLGGVTKEVNLPDPVQATVSITLKKVKVRWEARKQRRTHPGDCRIPSPRHSSSSAKRSFGRYLTSAFGTMTCRYSHSSSGAREEGEVSDQYKKTTEKTRKKHTRVTRRVIDFSSVTLCDPPDLFGVATGHASYREGC